jgi:hypothetical protein
MKGVSERLTYLWDALLQTDLVVTKEATVKNVDAFQKILNRAPPITEFEKTTGVLIRHFSRQNRRAFNRFMNDSGMAQMHLLSDGMSIGYVLGLKGIVTIHWNNSIEQFTVNAGIPPNLPADNDGEEDYKTPRRNDNSRSNHKNSRDDQRGGQRGGPRGGQRDGQRRDRMGGGQRNDTRDGQRGGQRNDNNRHNGENAVNKRRPAERGDRMDRTERAERRNTTSVPPISTEKQYQMLTSVHDVGSTGELSASPMETPRSDPFNGLELSNIDALANVAKEDIAVIKAMSLDNFNPADTYKSAYTEAHIKSEAYAKLIADIPADTPPVVTKPDTQPVVTKPDTPPVVTKPEKWGDM